MTSLWLSHLRLAQLTQKTFKILWTAVVRPVCVLQVPDSSLLARQQVFNLQTCGGVATGVSTKTCGDLKAAICNRVVAGA